MQIENDKVVSFDYRLTDEDGELLDSSPEGQPLLYLHGHRGIIPGLESALQGKHVGEQLTVTVEPKQAYGERNEQLVQDVPKSQFPEAEKIELGMQLQADTEAGPMIFTVVEIQEQSIQVDGNHPLAGETLNFDVTIREIRDATEEELQHGHVHGPGGHHH